MYETNNKNINELPFMNYKVFFFTIELREISDSFSGSSIEDCNSYSLSPSWKTEGSGFTALWGLLLVWVDHNDEPYN